MGGFRKAGGFGDKRQGGFRDGGNRFGGGRPRFDRDSGPREVFHATCASCGTGCDVPFRPTGERPVYCRDCFASNKPTGDDRGRRENRFEVRPPRREYTAAPAPKPHVDDRRIDEIKRRIDTLSVKLDRVLELLGDDGDEAAETRRARKPVDAGAVRATVGAMLADAGKVTDAPKKATKKEAKKAPKKATKKTTTKTTKKAASKKK